MYIDQPQYPPASPSPNLHRPNATPAPFYMAGAEVPPQPILPPAQTQQQQQYPQREQAQRVSSAGKQPPPIQTSTSPPPANQYTAYQAPAAGQRPQSTYGPQELSTSVYDSPIAPHNPNSAATYSSSVYSPDDPYNPSATAGGRPPIPQGASAAPPSAPAPSAPPQAAPEQRQGYQSYTPYNAAPQQPLHPSQPPQRAYGQGYDAGNDATSPPPPAPTGQAPPPPIPQGQGGRPATVLTPPPLQPGGAAYDARQNLPSRVGVGSPTGPPPEPPGGQPQYRAYVPPGGPPPGGPPGDAAPSAPGDYYRTAAY